MIKYFIDLLNKPSIQYSILDALGLLTLLVIVAAIIWGISTICYWTYHGIRSTKYKYNKKAIYIEITEPIKELPSKDQKFTNAIKDQYEKLDKEVKDNVSRRGKSDATRV